MLMQMLAAAGVELLTDGERSADEDNPRGYLELEAVKRITADDKWLGDANGKAVKIVHALINQLPPRYDYRIILSHRNINEVIASQRVMLERHKKSGGAIDSAALAAVFTQQLRKLDQWLHRQDNIELLGVSYNETLADPAATARAINDFLGGELSIESMAGAVSSELYRQKN
jgi:hypothetical protein